MRLLYAVQRYGDDIVGGSEAACRQFAEALTYAGHSVEVITSCARSYVTWEDSYEEGTTDIKPFERYSNVILRKGQYTGNQMMLEGSEIIFHSFLEEPKNREKEMKNTESKVYY